MNKVEVNLSEEQMDILDGWLVEQYGSAEKAHRFCSYSALLRALVEQLPLAGTSMNVRRWVNKHGRGRNGRIPKR